MEINRCIYGWMLLSERAFPGGGGGGGVGYMAGEEGRRLHLTLCFGWLPCPTWLIDLVERAQSTNSTNLFNSLSSPRFRSILRIIHYFPYPQE
jgi:hypothetical protein